MPVKFHRQGRQKAIRQIEETEARIETEEAKDELKDPPPLFDEDGIRIGDDLEFSLLPPLPPPPLDWLGLDLI